jgi:hypothetical protein
VEGPPRARAAGDPGRGYAWFAPQATLRLVGHNGANMGRSITIGIQRVLDAHSLPPVSHSGPDRRRVLEYVYSRAPHS